MKKPLTISSVIAVAILVTHVSFGQDNNRFDALKWREVGPTATGGRVIDLAVDPTNDHHILVASAAGGLWETTNNGTTWNCIFENENSISIGDVAFDPTDPKTIWIGTGEANNQRSSLGGDGVYKSTDGGKTWKNVGLQLSHRIGRIVIDPTDPQTVFVAALGNLYSANPERGLYKTSNGGLSWKHVLFVNDDVGVVDVIVDPKNSNIVVAASYERRRRAWNFDGAGPGSAIHRSTDGGKTWKLVTAGLPSGEIGRIGLDIYAKDPKIMYATVSNQNVVAPSPNKTKNSTQSGIPGFTKDAKPKSQDETSAFDPIKTNLGIEIEVSADQVKIKSVKPGSTAQRQRVRKNDVILSIGGVKTDNVSAIRELLTALKTGDQVGFVIEQNDERRTVSLVATDPTATQGRPIGGEIYRSDDSGATWAKVNKKPVGGTPAYYYGQIRVDPSDDQRIYVLSVPVHVSRDGGKTFSATGARSTHVDHHAFWINPKNSNHVMLGNDGGFHISYDRANTWDYVFNVPLAQFYAIGVDMQRPFHVYGGLQDNGTWGGPSRASGRSQVGRQSWYRVSGGDGFYVQIDPNNSDIVISESQFGAIGRSNRATGERKSIRPPQSSGAPHRYNWNSPILMSRFDSRTIYFAGNKLFKSYNQGDDWLTISPDLTTNDAGKIAGNVPHCTITTIAESPQDRNRLMVGTDDGKVQMTVDGGAHWIDLSNNFPFHPANWWCSRVEFSHKDKDVAYASFTGYREDDFRAFVFRTSDAGESWTPISEGLPNESVNVIKQDPVNPETLYVGTEFGAFVSMDDGLTWHELDNGLPRVSVQDLLVHPRDGALVIGTHGRGIFVLDEITPLQHRPKLDEEPAFLFPIRDWMPTPRTSTGGFAGDRKWTASNPQDGAIIWYELKDKVSEDVEFSLVVIDSAGKQTELRAKNAAGLNSVRFPRSGVSSSGRRGPRRRGSTRASTTPGHYKAILSIGDASYEQSFEIKAQ